MKTKIFRRIFVGLLAALSMTVCVNAGFTKTLTYKDGQFKDVKANAWYAKEVQSAYELGFMNGTGADIFAPDGNVTVAQGITMASRVHASYNGKTAPSNSKEGNWYDTFVKYALDNKIIADGQFDSYTRNITRAEMGTLFADAMPESEYKAINKVLHIPDVIETNAYASKLLMLYNAGIVMGSDAYGTFNPDADIRRSETAAIINRVAIPENRLQKTLKEYNVRDSYMFAYSGGTYGNENANRATTIRENIASGWTFDNRGGAPIKSIEEQIATFRDISTTQGTALIREFNRIDKDIVTADFSFKTSGDGFYTEFRDEEGKSAYQVKLIDGKWQLLGKDGKYTAISDKVDVSDVFKFRVVLDMVKGQSTTYINDVNCGTHALLSDNIINFRFATDAEHTLSVVPAKVCFTANYRIFDYFDLFDINEVYGWKKEGNAYVSGEELILEDKASVSRSFAPIDVKYAAETYVYRGNNENMALTVKSGDKVAVKLEVKNAKLLANGKEIYTVKNDMWYRYRIEGNPSAGKAKIYVNGRVMGEVPLNTTAAVDSYTISSESGKTKYDYIEVFAVADHYDYAPAPEKKANLDDYIVFMNVCSLWHNDGKHVGWACVTPFDEVKPVLGYYDEGVPELADWEVNYMVNHGIDVQVICWYNNISKGAVKDPRYSDALHEGLMYSKYGDYMKYVILWETGGTTVDSQQFRKHIVPYWFENYFLDDRYLKIDNRIVLHSFGANRLAGSTYFGSAANAKAELEYLNEVAKSYGFDGMLYTCADTGTAFEIGFEAMGAYHWGAEGNTFLHNKNMNEQHGKMQGFYQIPTVGVGFNSLGWHGVRTGLMSVSDYKKTHEWVKSEYIPKFAEKGTWQEKAIWISTWNEYGEGTYIMPSGLNGFGYVDEIRYAYTDLAKDHTDAVPNEAQRERINHLYPQYARKLLQEETIPVKTEEDKIEYEVVGTYTFAQKARNVNAEFTYHEDGSVSGVSTKDDVQLYPEGFSDGGVNVDDVDAVRIIMSVDAGSNIQVFFEAGPDVPLTAETMLQKKATTSEETEYIFNFKAEKTSWKGNVTLLRLDPCHNGAGVKFNIKKVEFLKIKSVAKEDVKPELYVNGVNSTSRVPAKVSGSRILFPYDPETAVHYSLYVFHTWNKEKGVLKIEGNNHVVTYTVGKDTYVVDGKEKKLGYTVELLDGLPLIDFEDLAKALDYTSKKDGTKVSVETPEFKNYSASEESKEGEWHFNGYETEGFTSSNMLLETNGEYLHMENLTEYADPLANNNNKYDIDTSKYSKFEIRVRYKYRYPNGSITPSNFCFYFLTDKDSTWNEAKTIKSTLKKLDTQGEWEVYTVDLTNISTWKNKLTRIRFDPFNAVGYMDVDYIKFIEKSAAESDTRTPEEKGEPVFDKSNNSAVNGNAEDTANCAFYSINGKVTIVEDDKKAGNHVYNVKANEGKLWTYFQQDYTWEKGKSYIVSFDARALPDNKGNKTDLTLGCNLQYKDTSGAVNHGVGTIKLPSNGEWVHFEKTVTIGDIESNDKSCFSMYSDPTGEDSAGCYQVDNVVIIKEGASAGAAQTSGNTIKNGDAEDTANCAFHSINGKVTIVEDDKKAGNHVYNVIANEGKLWTYFQQEYPFETGKSYFVSFDVRALPDNKGNSVNMVFGCNIQYKDTAGNVNHGIGGVKASAQGEWNHFEQTVNIGDMTTEEGRSFSIYSDPTGDDSAGCYQVDNVVVKALD